MTFSTALRLNMTGLQPDARDEGKRYRAALDMASYVDAHGFDAVALEEHHGADNGWLPSPLLMASAIAARTQRVRISVTALLVTLYDPVRLAEDIAVLDLISDGRFKLRGRQRLPARGIPCRRQGLGRAREADGRGDRHPAQGLARGTIRLQGAAHPRLCRNRARTRCSSSGA